MAKQNFDKVVAQLKKEAAKGLPKGASKNQKQNAFDDLLFAEVFESKGEGK